MTDSGEAGALLRQAQSLLEGEAQVGKSHSIRAACWLARSALEQLVATLLETKHFTPGEASMRSRMSCLEVAYRDEPVVVQQCAYAWAGLSNACHHHAFELSPSLSEARHLVQLVGRIAPETSP